MKGTVKMFSAEKGFGFITTEQHKDVFFHFSELVMEGYKTIEQGAKVEFEVIDTDRGQRAVKVVKVEE